MTFKPTQILAIIRVSTDEQAKDGRAGLARQEASVTRLCEDYPGTPVRWVRMEGVSGAYVVQSREWLEVEPLLGPTTLVAADAIDRLARMQGFDLGVLPRIHDAGAWIAVPGALHDPSDISSRIMLTLGAVMGGAERASIARRSQGAKEALRRQGVWVGRPDMLPTGIAYDRKTRAWGFTPDSEKVKRLFNLFLGGTSIYLASQELGWSPTRCRSVLSHPIYMGWMVYAKRTDPSRPRITTDGRRKNGPVVPRAEGDVIRVQVFGGPGQVAPLLSPEDYEQAQHLLRGTRLKERQQRISGLVDIPYSAFLTVANAPDIIPDGDVLSLDAPDTRHRLYGVHTSDGIRYQCRCRGVDPKRPSPKCDLPRFRAKDANTAIDRFLVEMSNSADFLNALRVSLGSDEDHNLRITAKEAELKKLKKEQGALVDLYVRGLIDLDIYEGKHETLKEKRENLEAEVEELKALASKASKTASVEETLAMFAGWGYPSKGTAKEKRAWLNRWVVTLSLSKEGVEGIGLKIPGRGRYPMYLSWGARTWEDLLGYRIDDKRGRWAALGKLTVPDIAARLGVANHRIYHLIESGQVVKPEGRTAKGGWREDDLPRFQAALEAQPQRDAIRHASYAERGLVTTAEIAKHYGVSEVSITRWVAAGRLPPHSLQEGRSRLWPKEIFNTHPIRNP